MRAITKAFLTSAIAVPILTTTLAAPGAAAEAAAKASCGKDDVCLFSGENFKGQKVTVRKSKKSCWTYQPVGYAFRVKSIITGKNRGISSMRSKPYCKGTPSMSYAPNKRVKKANFVMSSIR